jgi:predicted AAA+ superfamily ATPase
MVIDEIQRAPELLLAIKEQVDADPRPGRYLLSGSARVLALRGLPDTLPGRIEAIELWPFSQGEIDGTPDQFVDVIFEQGEAFAHESSVARDEYAERVVRGGFPRRWLARTPVVASASSRPIPLFMPNDPGTRPIHPTSHTHPNPAHSALIHDRGQKWALFAQKWPRS